jgi:hypothetical protein
MKDYESYHKLGYSLVEFEDTEVLERLNTLLIEQCQGSELPSGFFWESKYQATEDLRPDCTKLDDCFIDILVENKISEKISRLINQDLTLVGINLRKSTPHEHNKDYSYMPWHRDSYSVDGKRVGLFPPTHKLIFYPLIEETRRSLEMLQSSHICQYINQASQHQISPGMFQFDRALFDLLPVASYNSSRTRAVMFNTAMLHNVVPSDDRSIRVIWNFCTKEQAKDYYSHGNHPEISSLYEELKEQAI